VELDTVVEAVQVLWELAAAEAVDDEAAPGLGDALGSAEGLSRRAREDLLQGVVGEAAHHRSLAPLAGGKISKFDTQF
jgi:hypothetical protein